MLGERRSGAPGCGEPTDLSPNMADFEVYIDDDRYSVPSLYLITASSDTRARAVVEDLWRSSGHHLGAELRRDGERVAVFGSLADGTPTGRRQSPAGADGSAA